MPQNQISASSWRRDLKQSHSMRMKRRPIAIMWRSCSDSLLSAPCRASGSALPYRTANHSTPRLRACAISASVSFAAVGTPCSGGKRKGLWVGGMAPLGYDTKDRRIMVNEPEAETVRTIFRSYLKLGSLNMLMADLRKRGIVTKVRTLKTGEIVGGIPFNARELMRQKEVLNFKPAPRLEQIGDKCSKQVDDRKHRIG